MRRRSFHVVFVFAILASLCAAVGVGARRYLAESPDRAGQSLAALQLAPDETIAERLRSATAADDAASQALLILALGHERPALRRAAREALAERLDRWRLLPSSEATGRVERLAMELRRAIERLPEDSRPAAADVATQLLLWPVEMPDEGPRHEQLVADCLQILRSVGATRALDDPRATISRQPERFPSPASPERLR